MKTPIRLPLIFLLAGSICNAASVTYTGVSGGEWATDSNWSSAAYPTNSDLAFLDTTANLSVDVPNNIQGIRVGTSGDGRLQIGSRGSLTATSNASVTSIIGSGSGNQGYVQQEGGIIEINRLEIGSSAASGTYHIHSGSLEVIRESGGHSLFLARNGIGDGTFRISSGSLSTRAGVQLGSNDGGAGRFEVIGSHPGSIAIGSSGSGDGQWTQYAGSTLSVQIDKTTLGATPIFIDDEGDNGGGDVVFEDGALLEVGFTASFHNGGTFTLMEWEGTITDNGLEFAPSVDTNIWSFNVDVANKRLTATSTGNSISRNFVHPGLSHKLSDLDRMRDMVAAGIEPYASSFNALSATGWAQHTYEPNTTPEELEANGGTAPNNALRNDGIAAYYNALMWYITGDDRHAEASIRIFTAWSGVTNISGIPLNAGRHWRLIEAAEIIKHTYDGWNPADMQAFKDMLVYPGYSNTTAPTGSNQSIYWRAYQGDPARHGNQGLFAMRCVMAIGVFLDNEIIYDRALRYLQGAPARADDIPYISGPSIADTQIGTYEHFLEYSRTGEESTIPDYGYNEVIYNYVYPNGQAQEFSRDMAHGLAGIGIIATMAEMAWSQGDDLYGHLNNRPLLGLEYYYRYNLSFTNSFPDQTTSWEPTVENGEFIQRLDQSGRWFSLKANPYLAQNVDPDSLLRGKFNDDPMYEMNLGHYRDRIGVASDDTKWLERGLDILIADQGFEGQGTPWDHPSWGGLTFRRVSPGDPIQGFTGDIPDYAMNVLPMTIEAENYDHLALNGEGRTYHDTTTHNLGGEYRPFDGVDISTCSEGGYALTSLEADEWLIYTVSVPSNGRYEINIRYAAAQAGGKIQFSFDDVDISGEVAVPFGGVYSTGLDDWKTFTATHGVQLTTGVKSLKLRITGVSNAFVLNNITVARDSNTLVAHWAFDDAPGASTITDSSGNGYHGTNIGATSTTGVDGSALDFNGTDAEVSIPASTFDSIGDEITLAMWVYGDDSQPLESSIFTATSGNQREINVHLPWNNANVYWDAGNDSGYDRINKLADESQFKNAWNHWAFSKNAATGSMKIYHNGQLWHSATDQNITIAGVTSASIGSDNSSSFYKGRIDDVRLYDTALSDLEIASLYYQNPTFSVDFLAAHSTGATQVDLDWNPASGATAYTLKRSLNSGGPYTTLASDLTALNYVDTNLDAGTTYYYVVNANYDGIESTDSAEVSATPSAPTGSAPIITTTSLPAETIGILYQQTLSATGGDDPLTWSLSSGALPSGLTFESDGVISGTATQSGTYKFTVKLVDTHEDVDTQALSLVMYPLGGGPAEKFLLESGDLTVSEYQDPNLPANTIDADLGTRWSANGDGQWIRYDLGAVRNVQYLEIAWLSGDSRVAYFDIEVSEDDSIWTPLATGLQSSGTTVELQTADVPDTLTRYIRIVGYGNSGSSWNSITEVEIWGNTPVPPLTPTNLAATPGNGEIAINWMVSESATLHHLKRSTAEGSGYTTIASEAGASFLDTNVVNGTIYYYIISAENDAGESANSNPISAKPYAPITDDELDLITMTRGDNSMEMHLDSIPGRIYQLQKSDQLNPVDWQDLGDPIIGDGTNITLSDPAVENYNERFYRIVIQP